MSFSLVLGGCADPVAVEAPDRIVGEAPDSGSVVDAGNNPAQDAGPASSDAGPLDSGVIDAGGTFDAGTFDAGTFDAGTFDAGTFDAGTFDAGTFDAGTFDAGTFDAGTFDAGAFDAGSGPGADAGAVDSGIAPVVIIDLRGDNDRDGIVSFLAPGDDLNEDTWTATHGAVFLANLDDDQEACPTSGTGINDFTLPTCHDAADTVLNGALDSTDLARLKIAPWPDAPADAIGRLSVVGQFPDAGSVVRIFRVAGSNFTHFPPATAALSAADLRAGVEFGVEGLDIVRNPAAWNGFATVALRVTSPNAATAGFPGPIDQTDSVRLRVSPVMTFHHGLDVDTLYASRISGDPDSTAFNLALDQAAAVADAGVKRLQVNTVDQWNQDYFETGYMSMPAVGGQKVIRVNFRSANVETPSSSTNPFRAAGKVIFFLRGEDVAAVQQIDRSWDLNADSLDSFGNTETIPPYSFNGQSYPLGRILRGSRPPDPGNGDPGFQPDPTFTRLLNAQAQQPIVEVDTSWLLVGHVDETISFLRADSPRGWVMLVNDARLARQMLIDQADAGNGGVQMFAGRLTDQGLTAARTINQVLANTGVMAESAASAAEIDLQVAKLKAVTGLTEAEIIRVPYLHEPIVYGPQEVYSLAYQPGTVNGIALNRGYFLPPDPHGAVIGGVDMMKQQLQNALAPIGVQVRFIEDWDLYHVLAGEVHCGSNVTRKIPDARWWESGR